MIDLNDLLKNIDKYKYMYAKKGLKVNLNYFVLMEKSRKKLQLETEKMRALCNKLCGEVPKFRTKNKNTDELVKQIAFLDNVITENNKILNRYNKNINKHLLKLHNLPEFENQFNEQIITKKESKTSLSELEKLIGENCVMDKFKGTIIKYFKSKENFLLQEDTMPQVIRTKDGFLILCAEQDVNKIRDKFLDYFSQNAMSLIKVSCRKLNRANNASFYVHLNKRESVYLEINKQYYTRQYGIKYRSKDIDMTKFVNQINILLKW